MRSGVRISALIPVLLGQLGSAKFLEILDVVERHEDSLIPYIHHPAVVRLSARLKRLVNSVAINMRFGHYL
jgi:hypothetical protein